MYDCIRYRILICTNMSSLRRTYACVCIIYAICTIKIILLQTILSSFSFVCQTFDDLIIEHTTQNGERKHVQNNRQRNFIGYFRKWNTCPCHVFIVETCAILSFSLSLSLSCNTQMLVTTITTGRATRTIIKIRNFSRSGWCVTRTYVCVYVYVRCLRNHQREYTT